MKELDLGKEKISKLMIQFSVPCIISLLVNSLYNIVDQIFIGWGVGYLGNGATNVVFPLTMICLAFALMFGDGTSSYLSLKLGEKKKDEASTGVVNGILLSIIFSVIFCITCLLFLPQLVILFGATDNLIDYALKYGYIIAVGLPFSMIGTTLNSIIRADGSPKFAMTSMISGAILNIILDPIFIFVFKMGVEGAAIATILSQILTFIMNVTYIKKFKSVTINKNNFKLKFDIAKKVTSLGISSFITQMSTVIVMAISNNLLVKYGAASKYGSEIPITVLGIVMKISQILNSIIIGIAVGAQPIIGYNYGAEKKDRVKSTLKIVLISSLIVSTVAFILFQTIPDKLISVFGSGDKMYMEFASLTFRIFLMLCICNGIQIPSGIFFQAIGKSAKSAILSLSRQIILLIPSMIVLGNIFGLKGVLYSGPVADGMSFLLSVILLIVEVKNLSKLGVINGSLSSDALTYNKLNKHIIITISREYGSGGRYVGKLLAKKLGIKFYDKELVRLTSVESGLSMEFIENNEQKKEWGYNMNYYYNNDDKIFEIESKIIKKIANEDSCVIIGRCADYILKDKKNVTKIFIYSTDKDKVDRAIKYYGINKTKALKEINKINKLRAKHYKYYTNRDWLSKENYDFIINSDCLGVEKTAELISEIVIKKENL